MRPFKIDLIRLLELRTVVLGLGEAPQAGWWKSQFLSPTGLSFLARLYPHTYFAEAIRAGTLAAQDVHDANIGKGRVFHLFRLSQSIEREVERALAEDGQTLEKHLKDCLGDKGLLLAKLADLAAGMDAAPAFGPVLLDTPSEKVIATLAANYGQAFQQGKQVFPYFEELH